MGKHRWPTAGDEGAQLLQASMSPQPASPSYDSPRRDARPYDSPPSASPPSASPPSASPPSDARTQDEGRSDSPWPNEGRGDDTADERHMLRRSDVLKPPASVLFSRTGDHDQGPPLQRGQDQDPFRIGGRWGIARSAALIFLGVALAIG